MKGGGRGGGGWGAFTYVTIITDPMVTTDTLLCLFVKATVWRRTVPDAQGLIRHRKCTIGTLVTRVTYTQTGDVTDPVTGTVRGNTVH